MNRILALGLPSPCPGTVVSNVYDACPVKVRVSGELLTIDRLYARAHRAANAAFHGGAG